MIAIIDYDAGNIKSVEKAMQLMGQEVIVTRDAEQLLKADKVILPGVGAFGDAMGKIRSYGLEPIIHQIIDKKTPFLAICLGLQLLFDESEEAPGVKGLSVFSGKVLKIPEAKDLKIPQIGWNSLHFQNHGKIFCESDEGAYVYFVHSYYLKAEDESIVVATTEYGTHIHAAVERDNVMACQFHPEKSSSAGLNMLKRFVDL